MFKLMKTCGACASNLVQFPWNTTRDMVICDKIGCRLDHVPQGGCARGEIYGGVKLEPEEPIKDTNPQSGGSSPLRGSQHAKKPAVPKLRQKVKANTQDRRRRLL